MVLQGAGRKICDEIGILAAESRVLGQFERIKRFLKKTVLKPESVG
jgi:hypothetical protein